MHTLSEEGIIIGREDDLFHFWLQVFKVFEIYSIVPDLEKFVNHRLVSPLVKQRGHWVFFTVEDEENSRVGVSAGLLDEVMLLIKLRLHGLRYVAADT